MLPRVSYCCSLEELELKLRVCGMTLNRAKVTSIEQQQHGSLEQVCCWHRCLMAVRPTGQSLTHASQSMCMAVPNWKQSS